MTRQAVSGASKVRAPLLGAALGIMLAVAGCGGGPTRAHPLDSSWSDEDGSELDAFQHGWQARRAPTRPNVVIGVVDDRTLVGKALGGGRTWWYEHQLESRPQIAGSLVVGLGGGSLFALDAVTGKELWQRKALGSLRGAADDGETTLVSIASLTEQRSLVLAVARSGKVTRQLYLKATVGAPAVFDAYAFLPWNRHTVVVFDLVEATETARVVASFPVSNAQVLDSELYFGEEGLVRFDERIVAARRGGGTRVKLPKRVLPGAPRWLLPGTVALPPVATRQDTIRYYAQPTSDASGARIERYALSYRRLALGLEAPKGDTQWLHLGEHDHLGGHGGRDHVTLCDVAGDVTTLSLASGAVVGRESLGVSLLACAVQESSAPQRDVPRSTTLNDQLLEGLSVPSPELLPIQLELLEEIAAKEGDGSSRLLVALGRRLDDGEIGPSAGVRRRARELVSSRRSGMEALVAALGSEVGLAETPHIPVVALATAARRGGLTAAAPALGWLLNRPSLSPEQTEAAAAALEALAGPAQLGALKLFFARMRCEPPHPALERAVVLVARALVRLGAAELVSRVARGSCDHAQMKASLQAEVAANAQGAR